MYDLLVLEVYPAPRIETLPIVIACTAYLCDVPKFRCGWVLSVSGGPGAVPPLCKSSLYTSHCEMKGNGIARRAWPLLASGRRPPKAESMNWREYGVIGVVMETGTEKFAGGK